MKQGLLGPLWFLISSREFAFLTGSWARLSGRLGSTLWEALFSKKEQRAGAPSVGTMWEWCTSHPSEWTWGSCLLSSVSHQSSV